MAEGSESIGKSSPMKCQGTPPTEGETSDLTHHSSLIRRGLRTRKILTCSLQEVGRLRRNAVGIDATAARSLLIGNCRQGHRLPHMDTDGYDCRTRLWLAHKLMCGRTYRDAAKPRQFRVAPQGAPKEYSACEVRVLKTRAKSAC